MTVECTYCFEPLTYTGPLGNGDETGVLLRDDREQVAYPFCSKACMHFWVSLGSFFPDEHSVAHNVTPDDVKALGTA